MSERIMRRRILSSALVLSVVTYACDTPVVEVDPASAPTPSLAGKNPVAFQVASWNVYLGGDIGPVLRADFGDPVAVVGAAAGAWAQVRASNMSERASAVVDRLEEEQPMVMGLQEVFRFVELDGGFSPIALPLDMLTLLEAEITSRGLPYQAAAVQPGTSAALPIGIDFGTGEIDRWVAFTDRIVTLVRSDADVVGGGQGQYAGFYPLTPQIQLRRGWIRTDVRHQGNTYHVFNTHLEGQTLAPIQALQVDELLGSLTDGLPGTVVVMGDLNSDAAAGPGAPSWTPTYGRLLEAGFLDTWLETRPYHEGTGFTCCQDPGLRNGSGQLDERIDFVMVRQPEGQGAPASLEGYVRTWRIGEEQSDRTTVSGLWPSDHAGLSVELVLPQGLVGGGSGS